MLRSRCTHTLAPLAALAALPDRPDEDFDAEAYLKVTLPEVSRAVDKAVGEGKRVVVNCVSGVNRSATLVIGLLMLRKGMGLGNAMAEVARVRPVIHPCTRYQLALLRYGDDLAPH